MGHADREPGELLLQAGADRRDQPGERGPLLGARLDDLGALDRDAEIIGLDRLDRTAAVVRVGLHDVRMVVGLPPEFGGDPGRQPLRPAGNELALVALHGREREEHRGSLRHALPRFLPHLHDLCREVRVGQGLGPRDPFVLLLQGNEVRVRGDELPRLERRFDGEIEGEGGDPHLEVPGLFPALRFGGRDGGQDEHQREQGCFSHHSPIQDTP